MSAKNVKIPLKSQAELNKSIPIFKELRMTDAEVAIYTLLYCDIPARIAPPETEESELNCYDVEDIASQIEKEINSKLNSWFNPENISRFREAFNATTLRCEKPERLYTQISIEDYKFKIQNKKKLQVWQLLKKMLKTTNLNEVNFFLQLHRRTQIALLEAIARLPEFTLDQKYSSLTRTIENLHRTAIHLNGRISTGYINNEQFDTNTMSNMLYLFRDFSIPIPGIKRLKLSLTPLPAFNLKKAFNLLKPLNDPELNLNTCFYYLHHVADAKLMPSLSCGVITTITSLEEAYNFNVNKAKTERKRLV
ncbi:MAG: hypothetical protein JZU65_12370 [Chlorobium sp.]|nr:hypothetical protein [Chlorobium sp.]